jgi:hypothetical protein
MTRTYYVQHFPFQGPPKYTQIGSFGLKRNHLATQERRQAWPGLTEGQKLHIFKFVIELVDWFVRYIDWLFGLFVRLVDRFI